MPTRRAVLVSALAAAAIRPGAALAAVAADTPPASPTVLRLVKRTIEVDDKPASVYGIRQPDGAEGITTRVGDRFRVRVGNQIGRPSLVHWHGLAPPWQQDGVPGISGPPIPAGGSADYDFPLAFGGTFWMHSHQGCPIWRKQHRWPAMLTAPPNLSKSTSLRPNCRLSSPRTSRSSSGSMALRHPDTHFEMRSWRGHGRDLPAVPAGRQDR